ncbi:lipoate--protein ligase family protein [Sulfurirhabdus autotrophica]|uniref:Lipoate-protein ligase A n=1 Tax=Sulfurirhabdus autotrophica TaxID=1706046 RepID=A0A4R3XY21_9PROT|nr:biotin/lipoate A/B protein ligase family protein [Sulfurirhabdus autotrophica]TCV82553.1 lipoate-protein ligase A [Sulfurirhabdus autotrophica]
MNKIWRTIDTGLLPAAENMALNRALLEARQANEIPNTLRFLRFKPCALLGFHQSAEQELNLDYCADNDIDIQRRITGGGAIYFDETQIGWELYLNKHDLGTADMTQISRRICEAAAKGISALGVDAQYRPRNDIEVNGKKISGTGGAFDGDALMYQGTLLIQFDVEKMLRVLRIPAEKLSDKAIASARDRVANLADLLGKTPEMAEVKVKLADAFAQEFNVTFESGELSEIEQARYEVALAEIDHPDWVNMLSKPVSDMPLVEAVQKFSGGLLRVRVAFDRKMQRIKQVWFTGDVFVSPKRIIADLESALRDTHAEQLEQKVNDFFAQRKVDMLTLMPADFIAVITLALDSAETTEPIGQTDAT